jgi:hypothetical protein
VQCTSGIMPGYNALIYQVVVVVLRGHQVWVQTRQVDPPRLIPPAFGPVRPVPVGPGRVTMRDASELLFPRDVNALLLRSV